MNMIDIGIAAMLSAAPLPQQGPPVVVPPPASASQPTQSVAIDPARMAAAERLVLALRIESQYDTIFGRIIPTMSVQIFDSLKNNVQVPTSLRNKLADPAQLADAQQKFTRFAVAGFKARYPQMIKATAAEYAREFSVDELNGLIAFYDTPLGQKALAVLPAIQQRLFPIGEAMGREVGRDAMLKVLEQIDASMPRPKA